MINQWQKNNLMTLSNTDAFEVAACDCLEADASPFSVAGFTSCSQAPESTLEHQFQSPKETAIEIKGQ